MDLIYKGKTKDIYSLENGNILMKFKDDVTGKDGVFDPGENQVGLSIDGAGKAGLELTEFFFEKLNKENIPTHYVRSNLDENTMEVKKAKVFGKGLEFICRYKAVGSFYKRYGKYIENGEDLDAFFEITIKDDEAGDPTINKDALEILGIMTPAQYDELKNLTREICGIIKEILKEKDLDLYDIKLEFGLDENNNILLIDEISGGNMRVYKGKEYIEPLKLNKLVLNK
ncbi:phosphoribosylaminoimidazolesuccinocarboxamide synthase [uncultured Anaerococcus sp.]|uniref:phosphoribosylaminoimidazolesuccinocarboxamide synthase n=1 Tax=uncultured Anaerococcus sp. TaxID=293428 RepID=UPI00288AB251|nr:phosphoribosylaminoimidazolesuccinocarboxamide synthase [uncultured Anaerococcus sp.]